MSACVSPVRQVITAGKCFRAIVDMHLHDGEPNWAFISSTRIYLFEH